jgi:Ca2+-binding RTX toxin-like protein
VASVNRPTILILSGGALLAVIFSAGVVMSAANSVPTTGLANITNAVNPNQLKPSECNAINIARVLVVTPGVPFTSTGNSNDLVLGSNLADNITAGNGQDCVVGGGGNDTINGNQRDDILLGGAGNDDLDGGAGNDICYSGGGTDTFTRCETILP